MLETEIIVLIRVKIFFCYRMRKNNKLVSGRKTGQANSDGKNIKMAGPAHFGIYF